MPRRTRCPRSPFRRDLQRGRDRRCPGSASTAASTRTRPTSSSAADGQRDHHGASGERRLRRAADRSRTRTSRASPSTRRRSGLPGTSNYGVRLGGGLGELFVSYNLITVAAGNDGHDGSDGTAPREPAGACRQRRCKPDAAPAAATARAVRNAVCTEFGGKGGDGGYDSGNGGAGSPGSGGATPGSKGVSSGMCSTLRRRQERPGRAGRHRIERHPGDAGCRRRRARHRRLRRPTRGRHAWFGRY